MCAGKIICLIFVLSIFCSAAELLPDFRPSGKVLLRADDFLHTWRIPGNAGLLKTVPKGRGILFDYQGTSAAPVKMIQKSSLPVRNGAFLRLDYKIFKHKWNYGSTAMFFVEFLDNSGKVVARIPADRSNIPPKPYHYRPMDFSELNSFCGIGLDVKYFNYVYVPEKASAVRLAAEFSGNPGVLELKEWQIRETDPGVAPWFSQPQKGEQLEFKNSPAISDEELKRVIQKRPRAVSRLVRCGDRVEWHINGKRMNPGIFHNSTRGSYSRISAFAPAGFNFFTSPVILGRSAYKHPCTQIWREDGSFNIKAMEEAVIRVLREAPDAYVILNFIVIANAQWLKDNPGELRTLPDGTPALIKDFHYRDFGSKKFPTTPGESWSPSMFSKKYRRDVTQVLDKIMKEFEKSPYSKAVAGVYVTGGDDVQFRASVRPEFSQIAKSAFTSFLKEKYGNEKALAKAWRMKNIRFADVKIPSVKSMTSNKKAFYSEHGATPESDYREFLSSECADLKSAIRQGIKNASPRLLVGGYDNAMSLVGSTLFDGGRLAINKTMSDPGCDFLISLPSYGRERDECTLPMGLKAYTGSMRLRKKLIISEMDIRNPEQPPLTGWNRSRNWQAFHNHWTFQQFLNLNCGYAAAWGGMFHAYPLGTINFYDTPKALAAWKKSLAIASSAPGEKLDDERIAWVNNDRFCDYFTVSVPGTLMVSAWNYNIYSALWLSQIRFDAYLPEDLFRPDFKAPKVMLLGDVTTLKAGTISAIRKKFLKDGRVLIWLGSPGAFSGESLQAIGQAAGFTLTRPEEIAQKDIFIDQKRDALLDGVSGFLLALKPHYPRYYLKNLAVTGKNVKVLGYYQNTRIPGAVIRRSQNGTEIFIGQQGAITPKLLQNIARSAGIKPATAGQDLLVRGGGLIVLGASSGNGVRRIFYPQGVKDLECLTGQKILKKNKDFIEIYLRYGECAVFKHKSLGKYDF